MTVTQFILLIWIIGILSFFSGYIHAMVDMKKHYKLLEKELESLLKVIRERRSK